MLTQGARVAETDLVGDPLHRPLAGLQHLLCGSHPLCDHPGVGGLTGLGAESASEGTRGHVRPAGQGIDAEVRTQDRKSTRLNSSHVAISYAVFCLKKKNNTHIHSTANLQLIENTI